MREYRFIYKHSFGSAVNYIKDHAKISKSDAEIECFIKHKIKKVQENASIHWGQNYWNTATYAGQYRMLIKALAEYLGVDIKSLADIKEDTVWWYYDMFL